MKKFFLISICVFTVGMPFNSANATVKKCVPLVSNQTTCTSDPDLYDYHADWGAECTTNGVKSNIKGVGLCSNQQPDSCANGSCDWTWADSTMKSQTITTSDNVNDNKYCWCKMTSPAVSLWVFILAYGVAGNCAGYCATNCADRVRGNAGFRSALFSNMTD